MRDNDNQDPKDIVDNALEAMNDSTVPDEIEGLDWAELTQQLDQESLGKEHRNMSSRLRFPLIRRRRAVAMVAAAILAVAVLGWLTHSDGSNGNAYAGLLQAVNSSNSAEWVHYIELNGDETWISFQPNRVFAKKGDAVRMLDVAENKRYSYDPATRTITVSQPDKDRIEHFRKASNILAALMAKVESVREQGVEVEVIEKSEEIDGTVFSVFLINMEKEELKRQVRMLVEPETKRVVRLEMQSLKGEGPNRVTELDYPDEGPADIYALGVPENAEIIEASDLTNEEAIQAELAKHKQQSVAWRDPAFREGINEKVARLDILNGQPGREDVIAAFGKPLFYAVRGNKRIDEKNLPDRYMMYYPDRVNVYMVSGRVEEARFATPGYTFAGRIQVGSTLDEVLQVLPQPTRTVIGQKIGWEDGVLYKDIEGQPGRCYYARSDKGVRMFFRNNRVTDLYLPRPK